LSAFLWVKIGWPVGLKLAQDPLQDGLVWRLSSASLRPVASFYSWHNVTFQSGPLMPFGPALELPVLSWLGSSILEVWLQSCAT